MSHVNVHKCTLYVQVCQQKRPQGRYCLPSAGEEKKEHCRRYNMDQPVPKNMKLGKRRMDF